MTGRFELEVAAQAKQIVLARGRSELLDIEGANTRKESTSAGAAMGVQLGKSIDEYMQALDSSVPTAGDRINLYALTKELESRNATTANLGRGKAQLYMTPEAVNLNLANLAQGAAALWHRAEF